MVNDGAMLKAWTWISPAAAWLLIATESSWSAPGLLVAVALIASVLAAVHHAELVAHKVGEPFGTLILAIAVTVIELGLIMTLMTAPGNPAPTLARDTVFAAVMIILNGLVGACLLIGGLRHGEQPGHQRVRPGRCAASHRLCFGGGRVSVGAPNEVCAQHRSPSVCAKA